jgi:hypothetical protein
MPREWSRSVTDVKLAMLRFTRTSRVRCALPGLAAPWPRRCAAVVENVTRSVGCRCRGDPTLLTPAASRRRGRCRMMNALPPLPGAARMALRHAAREAATRHRREYLHGAMFSPPPLATAKPWWSTAGGSRDSGTPGTHPHKLSWRREAARPGFVPCTDAPGLVPSACARRLMYAPFLRPWPGR